MQFIKLKDGEGT